LIFLKTTFLFKYFTNIYFCTYSDLKHDTGSPEMTVSPIDAFPGFPPDLNPNIGEDILHYDTGKNYFGKVDVVWNIN